MKNSAKILFPLVAIGSFLWALKYSLRVTPFEDLGAKSLVSPQRAAASLGLKTAMGEIPEPDFAGHLFDGFTRKLIPVAEHFESPIGVKNGAFAYNAQGFLEYNKDFGGYHLGDDLNGIGGQNTDFGDPVYAAADGLVVYAAKPSQSWGNVMIIAHKLRDGSLVQTMYAHLEKMHVAVGSLIGRGMKIGTIGSADGTYLAHLHYEIRESDGVFIGPGYTKDTEKIGETLDPTKFVSEYNKKSHDEVGISALRLVLESELQKRIDNLTSEVLSNDLE
jgi:hypothetical protein